MISLRIRQRTVPSRQCARRGLTRASCTARLKHGNGWGGPIEFNDSSDLDAGELEGLINAWPLDEAFLDYVQAAMPMLA